MRHKKACFRWVYFYISFKHSIDLVSFFLFHSQDAKALKAKKEEGNKAFKDGNFEAAYELYSEALTIDPNNIKTNAKLYCNRATVGSKVSNMTYIFKILYFQQENKKIFGCLVDVFLFHISKTSFSSISTLFLF